MEYLPLLIFLGIGVAFAYMASKKGFKGALLGGKIVKTVGEAKMRQNMGRGHVKVHVLEGRKNEKFIALEVVQKTFLSYSMTPITLTRDQAEQAIIHLGTALDELDK